MVRMATLMRAVEPMPVGARDGRAAPVCRARMHASRLDREDGEPERE
jgi:hypothetical protein